jgi:hypothetical protein
MLDAENAAAEGDSTLSGESETNSFPSRFLGCVQAQPGEVEPRHRRERCFTARCLDGTPRLDSSATIPAVCGDGLPLAGHKNDWDFFAAAVGDKAWRYESVLKIYRRIEHWHGAPDPDYRGTGGPVFVQPAPDPNPIAQEEYGHD